MILEARGGVEPRAFPPSSFRFGLEDRRRERGPDLGGDGEIRTHTLLFTGQLLCQLELHRLLDLWSGREADDASANSTLPSSHRSAGMSRPDNLRCEFGAQGRTRTFNLWLVGPALYQLSYSGRR